jgi:hypothetical protein
VGQTINLVHDNRVDQAFFDIFEQALEPRSVCVPTGVAPIVDVIGLPPYTIEVGFPEFPRPNDFMTDRLFETAAISLCPGPPVCSPPRSFLPLQLIAAGQPRLLRPS